MTTPRPLVLFAVAGFQTLSAQEFYLNGTVEMELHNADNRAHATFARREGVLPPDRLATGLPFAMQGAGGEYKGERGLSISLHSGDQQMEIKASGPLPSGKGADVLSGNYRHITPAEHLAAEKERASRIDVELNRVYGELKTRLKAAQYEELRDTQREWIRYTYESGALSADPGEDAEAWRGRADAAAERIQFLKSYSPGNSNDQAPDLRTQLAAAEEAEAWDAAAEIARRILVISPRDGSVWESRVRALMVRDKDRAAEALEEWTRSPASKPPVMDQFRGEIADSRKEYDQAARYWVTYLKSAPKDAETRSKLATVYVELENYPEAVKMLEQRVKLSPSGAAYARLAVCHALERDWKGAGVSIRQGNSLDATDDTVKRQLPRIERLEKALPEIKAADQKVATALKEPSPLLDRGLLFIRLEWGEIALQDAKQARRLNADSRRALLQMGVALRVLNRTEEFEKLGIESVSATTPSPALLAEIGAADAEVQETQGSAAARARRATLLNRASQRNLALAEAEEALKMDKNNDEALTARGRALLKLGREWEGLPDLVRATEINPRNALAWLTRGEVELQHLDFARAIDALSKAIQIDPVNRAALELRERSFRAAGRLSEADVDATLLKTL